jgi:hypothetical protein
MTMQKRLTTIAAGMTLGATALLAQVQTMTVPGQNFQQAGTLAATATVREFTPAITAKAVTGSPFSATEENRTVQTLGDGTLLESSETSVLYRDTEGRTRVERTAKGKTMITITDPVAKSTVRMDPATKIARKVTAPGGGVGVAGTPTVEYKQAYEAAAVAAMAAGGGRGAMPAATTPAEVGARTKAALEDLQKLTAEMNARQNVASRMTTEDLGGMNHNGVPAQGTRTTVTIPVGQIGNNREIKVVNERWFSQDLQMMVKTVNSDPRFGTTTYELKNIVRVSPDANLFQIPSDYTTVEGGGRGGRGQ